MEEQFIEKRFNSESKKRLAHVHKILKKYGDAGYKMTLRQVYYQLVTRNVIPNNDKAYKQLSELLSNARLAGVVDWEAIEDRIRVPSVPYETHGSCKNMLMRSVQGFTLPKWRGQKYYVELWVEKDAIANILSPIADEQHVVLMVNRGYSSQSAMYDASYRFNNAGNAGKENVLLYLGDLDPSGEDMVRDIDDRLVMFRSRVEVRKIALNIDQVRRLNLPPNPAKRSDPRSRAFIEQYGAGSWELDAIPPDELERIVTREIEQYIDRDVMNEVLEEQQEQIEAAEKLLKKLEE